MIDTSENVLRIELTDESDPFFLYVLDVSEEDYHELKRDQSLRVDFERFPRKFVELLRLCRRPDATEVVPARDDAGTTGSRRRGAPISCFEAILGDQEERGDNDGVALRVVEANPFKNLLHLSLRVRKGSDADVKRYLAGRLRSEQRRSASLATSLRAARIAVEDGVENETALREENERLSERTERMTREEEIRRTSAINKVREEAMAALETERTEHERRLEEMRSRRETEVSRKDAELTRTRDDAIAWREKAFRFETQWKGVAARAEGSEKELTAERALSTALRAELAEVKRERLETEKELQTTQVSLAKTEQALADKERLAARMSEISERDRRDKAAADASVRALTASNGRLQKQLEQSVREIRKGNGIISRLQEERRELKSKIRITGKIVREQEARIERLETSASEARDEVARYKETARSADAKRTEVEASRDRAVRQLEESKDVLNENQRVITWLNRQLNDAKMERETRSIAAQSYKSAYAFDDLGGSPRGEVVAETPRGRREDPTTTALNASVDVDDVLLIGDRRYDARPDDPVCTFPIGSPLDDAARVVSSSRQKENVSPDDDLFPEDDFGRNAAATLAATEVWARAAEVRMSS